MSTSKPKGITVTAIKKALRENGGLIAQSAQALGISRQALHQRLKLEKNIDVKEYREENFGMLVDGMEGAFYKLCVKIIKDPTVADFEVMKYFLETHARDRGYGQKLQLSGPNDAPLFDPVSYATFLASLTDEQRAAYDTLAAAPGPSVVGAGGEGPTAH